jgi:hypothetical protein
VIYSKGTGTICLRLGTLIHSFRDCLYSTEFGLNILSVSQLVKTGFEVNFNESGALIIRNGEILAKARKNNGLYDIELDETCLLGIGSSNKLLWHKRLGHLGESKMRYLKDNTIGINEFKTDLDLKSCDSCLKGKLTYKVNHNLTKKPEFFLDKLNIDLTGPISPEAYNGFKYILLAIDAATRWVEIRLLTSKDESVNHIVRLNNIFKNHSQILDTKLLSDSELKRKRGIKTIKTDGGKEFVNTSLKQYCDTEGIVLEQSAPYSHEQNGLVERMMRTILNIVRSLLSNAQLPKELWGEAAKSAVYVYNRSPHSSLGFKTPFEKRYKSKPDISNIRLFGSLVYHKDNTIKVRKLDNRSKTGVLVGYGVNQYSIYDPIKKTTTWSRDVVILEDKRLNHDYYDLNKKSKQELIKFIETNANPSKSLESDDLLEPKSKRTRLLDDDLETSIVLLIEDASKIHKEPSNFNQAISSPDKDKWLKAMNIELDELIKQRTWDLVDLPPNRSITKGRWVFKIKTNSNNKITKYKARWVVKGFTQIEGLDYTETFASTARPEVYRLLFAIANYYNWHIKQWDVKNAFVHADIDTDLYIEQPIGFINQKHPKKVCKLNKALYGLKQSSRLWAEHLTSNLKKLGFKQIDPVVFKHEDIYILTHVDDLLVIGPNKDKIARIYRDLAKTLTITDLEDCSYFLGIEILRNRQKRTLILSQEKYLDNILDRFDKKDLKPVLIPAEAGIKLSKNPNKDISENLDRIRLFQQQIGSLIYLSTRTRPDISFAVNYCARFMSNPSREHFIALDKIWKYLNGSRKVVLEYQSNSDPILRGYSDSDWGGDMDTRRSTTGYYFSFLNTPISWNSKLQKSVALSSCEAEYMALKEATKEMIYLQTVLKKLDIKELSKFLDLDILYTDSQPAIDLANNPEHHYKSKHIDIQYHYVRELVLGKKIRLTYLPTKEQIADLFTKGVNSIVFSYLKNKMISQKEPNS